MNIEDLAEEELKKGKIEICMLIDAIPIEWIRNWLDELRGTYTDDIQEELTKKHLIISIEALLFKWRKENEQLGKEK